MFYSLYGDLIHTEGNLAVIECGGIGYKLTVSNNTFAALPFSKEDKKIRLFTHLQVREDGIELFGFYSNQELNAFRLLTSVSGVGPKAAMAILSQLSPEKFAVAVVGEDAKAISRAQGVGAKIAARIILELKDKIAKEFPIIHDGSAASDSKTPVSSGERGKLTDAQDTLIVLGYTRSEAINVLRGADTSRSVEEIIKLALTKLMK